MKVRPAVILIMDGWGIAKPGKGNAISLARKPNFDRLSKQYPYTELGAGGESIGLWKGHQGSSETGHFIIGAGRKVFLPQGIIASSIADRSFFRNKAYLGAIEHVKKHDSTLHFSCLMSDKGVHGYDMEAHSMIEMAAQHGIKKLAIHYFSDGRDTAPHETLNYLERLEGVMKKFGIGTIATVMGRYWIMDRDHRWERVEVGYNAMVHGRGMFSARSAREAIQRAYGRAKEAGKNGENFQESDEFIKPTVIVGRDGKPVAPVRDNDAFIWLNFRNDRAIEISQAFTEESFKYFPRGPKPNVHYVATFKYYDTLKAPYAFEKVYPEMTLGETLSKLGLRQFRVTETEKWIYVTTIFSGMRETPFKGEDRLLIPSDKIPTYDLKPKMKTAEIALEAVKKIEKGNCDFILINFNNPDIIGHTGKVDKAVEGVETVDQGVGEVCAAALEKGWAVLVTADHGNAEVMLEPDGTPNTYHTANDVPFILVTEDKKLKSAKLRKGGTIADIAPTVLDVMGVKKPKEMTGVSLILK
jgi:2,3-bisphosphoglycerate-independent phosphoglycerate mutase